MALFVKKLVVFLLLPILLLTCSSYANDNLPQVRVEDRKLLQTMIKGVGKQFHKGPFDSGWSKLPISIAAKIEDSKRLENWIKVNTQAEDELSGVSQKVAETIVMMIGDKLFLANGRKKLSVGWTVGKWIYKLDEKCEKVEKYFNIACEHSKLTDDIPGMSCIILVAGDKTQSPICNEGILTQENIPCYYSKGTVSTTLSITKNPLNDCVVNQVP
ncbi:uncharacterized protein LOC111908557 [Lactuca sativa]|uniref:Secreted protein n=1 Tax=Lactuca sativa TaxID=4236 RepID=A0A9R1XNA2_LACSA|nr:uncharacterized protein LOC111908557 [Lactuca sativa]KAJ0221230.1 hypothetical protein LSAT_V11C200050990 [Lactuca sativa]